jgi:hypothetical protein
MSTATQAGPQIAENEQANILSKAVCLNLELAKPGNSRKVSTSQIEVDADKALIHVSKKLLDSEEYKKIVRHDNETRLWLYSRALPGPFRAGTYLIPHDLVLPVDAHLRIAQTKRDGLIDEFLAAYPTLQAEAEEKLAALYNPTDYPASETVKAAFSMRWSYFTFQTPEKLKSISASLFQQEQEKAATTWKEATDEVRQALRAGFGELVAHMTDRLTGDKIFRNSLVENFADFLETFQARNITNDEELQSLVGKARQMLDGVNPDDLRKQEGLKDTIAAGMGKINSQLDSMIVNRPKRKLEV